MKSSTHTFLLFALAGIFSLTLWNCDKDDFTCPDDDGEFCQRVGQQDFDGTGPFIDEYLTGLPKNRDDENLERLVDWLECQSCVEKVTILCNSCIETLPPQSELQVNFVSGGKTTARTLDIIMDEPLQFRTFH